MPNGDDHQILTHVDYHALEAEERRIKGIKDPIMREVRKWIKEFMPLPITKNENGFVVAEPFEKQFGEGILRCEIYGNTWNCSLYIPSLNSGWRVDWMKESKL